MTPERLEQLKMAFPIVFGIPFEKGVEEVRFLTRSYTSMAKMNPYMERAALTHGLPISSSSVRMSERDFAMTAFFALMGLETTCGGPSEEQPAPEAKKLRGDNE